MVGDTMETDILGAVQMGYRSILVLSGTTNETDLAQFAYAPDRVIDSVAELTSRDVDLLAAVPSGDVADDSAHDIRAWARSAT